MYLQLRFFELAADGSEFLLFYPGLDVVEGNRADLTLEYDRAVGGWVGQAAQALYLGGQLGAPLFRGGDGRAEARYLETDELLTRQLVRGSAWLWNEKNPRLLIDHTPVGDQIDHAVLGFFDPAAPEYDAEVAERIRDFRARVWSLVDLQLARLLELGRPRGAALFLVGDRGLRSSWRVFRPNVALRDAGLLAPEREAEVLARARAAIGGVVDEDGERVVVRTFTPEADASMGLGGPAGGDLYWATRVGCRSSSSDREREAAGAGRLIAGHGFPPDEPDMQTVFCAVGSGFCKGVRGGAIRITAVAPTISSYLGVSPPLDAVGHSILDQLATR